MTATASPDLETDSLLTELCERLLVPPQRWVTDPSGLVGLTLRVDNVDVTLLNRCDGHAGAAICILVEFGAPAAERELDIWRFLADANFLMLGPEAPAFSRNPATGDVLLQYAFSRAEASAAGLQRCIVEMARLAARWRQDFFLPLPAGAASTGRADTGVRYA